MDELVRLRPRQTSTSQNNTTDDYVSSGEDGPNDPLTSDSKTESNWSSDSATTSTGLSAVIRVMSDSLLRTELAEMEMIKARETARWEAEKRRMEMELELTRMALQTHLQATTSLLVEEQEISPSSRRKRKRSQVIEDESSTTSLALLGLLQLNLIFSNSLT
ncbi:Uncharacterized protein Rs2_07493 [Raphanus sativus]|uniref:Uncharacterized protein At4g22160 isoform X2 n=1 Tax=Raphanus sativus TaxID=3726 RepID=A0A6J0M7S9_RAPSA|nr:uncharacterized protein At4g22160 isoform X2 [Raphanus sativus]KAJ4912872.1 Uncharacterized protein Rs2_07493 [Raphanus sativus]